MKTLISFKAGFPWGTELFTPTLGIVTLGGKHLVIADINFFIVETQVQ